MRIGIDGGSLANRRGFGRFARSLLEALGRIETDHRFVVLIDRPSLEAGSVAIPGACETIAVEVREAPSTAASATGRRRLGDMLAFGRAAATARLDAMVFPTSYSFFPVWNVGRVAVTIFDTLPLTYPDLVFPSRRGQLLWSIKERLAVAAADLVLTTSDASRRDLRRHYRLADARIGRIAAAADAVFRPTEPGPDSDASLARHGLRPGERFLLYVGGLSPHKNLPRLIAAFARSAPADVRLAIVGDFGDVFHTHVPELMAAVVEHGLTGRVLFPGYVPDADLVHLYGRALALVQPSLMEGFGLPPVEAMACGTPVLASTAGSLPEVVGDGGVFFDPMDVGAIADAIAGICSDPARRDRHAGHALRRAGGMTWEHAARQLVAHLEAIAADRPATEAA